MSEGRIPPDLLHAPGDTTCRIEPPVASFTPAWQTVPSIAVWRGYRIPSAPFQTQGWQFHAGTGFFIDQTSAGTS